MCSVRERENRRPPLSSQITDIALKCGVDRQYFPTRANFEGIYIFESCMCDIGKPDNCVNFHWIAERGKPVALKSE